MPSDLRVLYVGPDPTRTPKVPDHVPNKDRMVALIQERPKAFQDFLREHFATVEAVTAEIYHASMSDKCDVTIFDALPEPIATHVVDGFPRRLRLPDDFDKPALTVGEVGPFMLGRFGFGLKLDHL